MDEDTIQQDQQQEQPCCSKSLKKIPSTTLLKKEQELPPDTEGNLICPEEKRFRSIEVQTDSCIILYANSTKISTSTTEEEIPSLVIEPNCVYMVEPKEFPREESLPFEFEPTPFQLLLQPQQEKLDVQPTTTPTTEGTPSLAEPSSMYLIKPKGLDIQPQPVTTIADFLLDEDESKINNNTEELVEKVIDEHNTISTAEMVHSSYSQLMDYLEETASDVCLKPTTSDLNPTETLLLNDRTMKHILLYTNPKYSIENAREVPENFTLHKKRYPPIIYDERNYIPPGRVAVDCFEESDIDLELKTIFKQCPPAQSDRYTRTWGKKESITKIDSCRKTKDLKKFGHPSYFMPSLTTYHRNILGWKPEYRHGKRKYHKMTFRNPILPYEQPTFCEFVAHINDPPDPFETTCNSRESFEKGPRIRGFSFKEQNERNSIIEKSLDKILDKKRKKKKKQRMQRFMSTILPCWWYPPIEDDEEDWQITEPSTLIERVVARACDCFMPPEIETSAHDIAVSEINSSEGSIPPIPPRIMNPIKPGPCHRNRWLLPRPTPLPAQMSWDEYFKFNGGVPSTFNPPRRLPFTPEGRERAEKGLLRFPSELNI